MRVGTHDSHDVPAAPPSGGPYLKGPKPDNKVRDILKVLLGTPMGHRGCLPCAHLVVSTGRRRWTGRSTAP